MSETTAQYPVKLRGTGAPVLMWAHEHEVEASALQQLRDVSELPGLHGLRVMPDVHWGNGATVGSVIAMEQALAPAAVGVDIGCGVNAVRTNLTLEDLGDRDLHALRLRWEKVVPVGFSSYERAGDQLKVLNPQEKQRTARFLDSVDTLRADLTERRNSDAAVRGRAAHQLGSLGGGNHFIELCSDSIGRLWITLHSGSRNIGKSLAERHIQIAKGLKENEELPKHLQPLSLFYKGTKEMDDYLHDLRWAQEFAMLSRTVMMEAVKHELQDYFENSGLSAPRRYVNFDEEINCHHNYVAEEMIDGKMMIVTRKGAISAKKGERALIPGSMATGSYVVRGLGNEASFQSASHGAGRKMSRGAAKEAFRGVDDGAAQIARQLGSVESRRDSGILDELPEAYKPIEQVIAAEKDLVEVEHKLETILCVKG
ncbi:MULTISPECIES: RtcB family protein [unclassified Microbacterium]|uniref:RtcB family protein n=1 Tax=unclassified Microbacterium TaxID=2609290 RepID=UPI000EA8BAD8|nr:MULTISPECIES: RtcB family protein [unclassified Microbacterium]MBT2484814.1 RtcB family protein [Microbacterium sp. ISL-108]RKN67686.1 RtcB family protein [Microbacterium sp. CGR2]